MNILITCIALYAPFITHSAQSALAPAQIIFVPAGLASLYEWVELNKTISAEEAKKTIIEKITNKEEVPQAYLVGAALAPRYGNALAILATILNSRILFYQGVFSPASKLFVYNYFSAYQGDNIGCAWGFRPTSLKSFAESDDLARILSVLARKPLDIKIDLLALKNENGWINYDLITAYALIKKYGLEAHKKVSTLLQNRMEFIQAPASKNFRLYARTTPLFIDSLITPEEYFQTVKKYPILSLHGHNGLLRSHESFLWEVYHHAFINDVDAYIAERTSCNLRIPPATLCAARMSENGTIIERCTTIQAHLLEMLIAEKFGDLDAKKNHAKIISKIMEGASITEEAS